MSFIDYIKEGNLGKTKHFLQENLIYYIHKNNEEAFRRSCENCHLDIAKWLWDIVIWEVYGQVLQ